jgi:tetratricopeptide (TPR) repeat protein
MTDPAPPGWGDHPAPDHDDSIAGQLASRMATAVATPDEALDWAAAAAGFEREALARGPGTESAALLTEAAVIHEARLGAPAEALALLKRAVAADAAFRPALRAARRLASDLEDLPLLADLLAAEEHLEPDPAGRAELATCLSRVLGSTGRSDAGQLVLTRAQAADPTSFGVVEELALRAAAAGDRRALAEAWLACAAAAGEPRLEADFLTAAAGLLADALGDLDRAGALALRAFQLSGADPLVRATARRHAERLGRPELLASILRADAEGASPSEAALAWLELSRVLSERLDRPDEAIQALERGRSEAPAEPLLLAELARLRERRGEWAQASDALRDLAGAHLDRQDPAHLREAVAAWLRRAEIEEERLGHTAEASACCSAVLALEPGHRAALSTLGRLCARTGDWDGLLETFVGEALASRDVRERAQKTYKAAEVLEERLGDPERAAALYREALSIDPTLLAARAALERLHESQGAWAELVALLEADLTDLSSAPEAAAQRLQLSLLQRRAELLEEHLDDAPRARLAWEEVRALAPSHLPALRALGRIHAASGQWESLIGLFRSEADAAGDAAAAAEYVLRIADILDRRLGSADEAIAAYREVLTLAPAHLPAMNALARLYRERGEHESLVEVLRAEVSVRAAPIDRAALLTEVGRLWEGPLGQPSQAVESYEEALRSAPGFSPACRALDRLYASLGRWRDLADLRREEAATATDATAALLGQARLSLDRDGDPAEARRLAGEATAASPGHPGPLLFDLRLDAAVPARRAALRIALADAAPPVAAAAFLLAAAADLPRRSTAGGPLARAAALTPASVALAPEVDRLAAAGAPEAAARHAEHRAGQALAEPERAHWFVRAAEAWLAAGDEPRAAAAVAAALAAQPTFLPALRVARGQALRGGDHARARDLLRVEAGAQRDAHGASSAFLEAGALSERLGDAEDAALDYRLAAELDPLAPAPLERLERLLAGRGAQELLAARQARARAEREPARAADAWLAVARAALAGTGGLELARSALERALTARPGNAAALELRARMRAEAGEAADAVADYEASLAAGGDAATRLAGHLAAAALCLDQLHDGGRARAHLDAALQLQPEHQEALTHLARLHEAEGRFQLAADPLRRLLAIPGLARPEAAAHRVSLARIEARQGDEQRALAHVARALELVPGHAEALKLMVELERKRADPRALAAALEVAAAAATDGSLRAELRLEAARLHSGPLRQRTRAVELLKTALDDDPGRDDARAQLALAYEESAPALAVEEHRRLLEREPLRAESWTALYRLFERLRAHDRAYVAATILRWLGAPTPGPTADRLLLEGDRQALPSPPSLSGTEFDLLRPPGDRGPMAALFDAVGDALGDALGAAARLAADEAPAGRGDHPLRRPLAEVTRALGAGDDWDLVAGPAGRLLVEPGERPVVRCGADLARRTTERERRFLLGRVASRLRTRSGLAETADDSTLGLVVAAAVRQVVPGWSATGEPSDELVRRLGKLVGRRARKALDPAARALSGASAGDLAAWRAASATTADRAGLVLCGDVPTAVSLLVRGGPGNTPADGPPLLAAVWEHPQALALLAFAASEAHFSLRQKLRVAIA